MNPAFNADPAELAKFGALAQRWWDPSGESRPLHDLNPVRLAFVESCMPLAGRRVLDVGCGGGLLSEAMAVRGAVVTGIDLAPELVQVARLHALETGARVDYREISAESLAETDAGSFDLLTCMEMLEHVPDPRSVVSACAQLVKPGGVLVFSTINRTFKAFAGAILGAEYLLGLLPRGTHSHARFIKPSELATWLREQGLEVNRIAGLSYNPFTRKAQLSVQPSINYLLAARKP